MTKYNTPVLFALLVLVVLSRTSSSLTPVQVNNKPLLLSRGGHLDLQNLFVVDKSIMHSSCEIFHVHKQLSCGEVNPSVFPCGFEGVITYQHYGCLLDKQLVTLQLSYLVTYANLPDANVHIFSIELLIVNNNMLNNIQLNLININPKELASNKTVDTYRLIFPPRIIGKCHYEVLNNFEHLNLPMYGELFLDANTLAPCGFAHYNLQYTRNDYTHIITDFILLRVYIYSESSNVAMYYAAIPLYKHSNGTIKEMRLASRMPKTFTVRQTANMPVTPNKLIDGINPTKYIVEIRPLIGSFRTPQSTELNISFTEFTEEDLLSGCVSFNPHYNSPRYSPSRFQLRAVYNVLGSITIEDDILVTSENVIFLDQAVQRTNKPLKVIQGGMVWINSRAIEFYLLGECILNAKMQLTVFPKHGHISQSNGSQANLMTTFSVQLVSNGTVLVYKHCGDEIGFDHMVWEVSCLNAPVLRITMTVLVARIHNIPPVNFQSTQMFAYDGWSQPMTLSSFKAVGAHSIVGNPVVNVHHTSGTLVKTLHALEFKKLSWLFPLVRLHPSVLPKAASFLLLEVQQQLIWYVPPNAICKDTIEISLTDSYGNVANTSINVNISQRSINETILITTTDDYPPVYTKSSNMTIISTQPVYITTHHLYSALSPFSDESIVYLLTSQLQNGTLCITSPATCLISAQQFTQRDINQQKLYFLPTANFTGEVVTFEITVENFKSHFPKIVTIAIRRLQNVSRDVKTFWIRDGREKRLRPDHFPVFPKKARLVTTQGTEYGMLSFRINGSNSDLLQFNHEDLANKRVWYTHSSTTLECSDSFKFNIILENETESFNFLILIRRSRKQLAVTIFNTPYSFFENNRFVVRKESFLIQSSFCPEFVTFNVVAPPRFGILSVIDLEHSVVVQLNANSKFTLKDVNTGLVHYTVLDSHQLLPNNKSDFVLLNASDPVSSWPLERRQTPRVGRFELLIDTRSEVIENLDLKIKTPRTVTWLPKFQKYGAILSKNDIDITNSSVYPTEVNIQVNFDFNFYYQLEIDSTSVSVFTLDDIYSGRVTFVKIMLQENDFKDTITFAVNVEIDIKNETFTAFGGTHSLTFVWALVQFNTGHLTVSEEREFVNFILR